MYQAGQLQLQSSDWMKTRVADRPTFQALVTRGLTSQRFHVFLMPQGILFLEPRKPSQESQDAAHKAAMTGAMLGGLVGAIVGEVVGHALAKNAEHDEDFDTCANEQVFALARARKKSFVIMQNEVTSIAIDAPGMLSRMFGGNVAGTIEIRDSKQGKTTVEVKQPIDLAVAVDALPRRFGERARVNVRWDEQKMRFFPK